MRTLAAVFASSLVLLAALLSSVSHADENSFASYKVSAPSQINTQFPNFDGDASKFKAYRILIEKALKQGPNFSGFYSVVEYQCGSDCVRFLIVDHRSGVVQEFDPGGPSIDEYRMKVAYRLDSSLLIAQWASLKDNTCTVQFYDFAPADMRLVSSTVRGTSGACDGEISLAASDATPSKANAPNDKEQVMKLESSAGWETYLIKQSGQLFCTAIVEFPDQRSLRMGVDRSGGGWKIGIDNGGWSSIKPGEKYPVAYVLNERRRYTDDGALGVDLGIRSTNLTEQMIEDIASSKTLSIVYNGQEVDRFSLRGSREAITSLRNCEQQYLFNKDPFSSVAENDPFLNSSAAQHDDALEVSSTNNTEGVNDSSATSSIAGSVQSWEGKWANDAKGCNCDLSSDTSECQKPAALLTRSRIGGFEFTCRPTTTKRWDEQGFEVAVTCEGEGDEIAGRIVGSVKDGQMTLRSFGLDWMGFTEKGTSYSMKCRDE